MRATETQLTLLREVPAPGSRVYFLVRAALREIRSFAS